MLEPFENIVVTVGAGVTNNRAVINGAVIVNDGGTNAADVVGSVTVNSGGTNSGNVTGNLYITSSTAVNTATAVTGNIILAEGVTNALSSLVRYSGSVVQVVSGSLNATTYTGGTAGSPVTAPNGTYYNLAGDSKARTYTSGTGALFTGAAYNLTGDLRAYSWASGVKGALYTGDIGLVSYVDGVVQTGTPHLSWTVSNDDNAHVLYTAATATSAATGTVYRNSALTVLYSGLFTEGGQNYYAPYGVAQTYLQFVVTLDSNSVNPGYLYADPMFNGGPLEYIYTEPSLTNKYTGFYKSASTYVIVAAGVVSYFTGNYLIGGLAYSIAEGDEVGLFTGNAYNLTGDSKAYSWADGVKGALFTGTIGDNHYTAGVLDPSSAMFSVTIDGEAGQLFTAVGGSIAVGPVYTASNLLDLYTGVFTYTSGGSSTTYYADIGTPNTYRAWTVSDDNNANVLYTIPAGNIAADTVYTNTNRTTEYTGVFTYTSGGGPTTYYATIGTPNVYRAWTVSNDNNANVLYTIPAGNIAADTVYTNTNRTTEYTGPFTYTSGGSSTNYYADSGFVNTYRAWTVSDDTNSHVLYTQPLDSITTNTSYKTTGLIEAYTGGFKYDNLLYRTDESFGSIGLFTGAYSDNGTTYHSVSYGIISGSYASGIVRNFSNNLYYRFDASGAAGVLFTGAYNNTGTYVLVSSGEVTLNLVSGVYQLVDDGLVYTFSGEGGAGALFTGVYADLNSNYYDVSYGSITANYASGIQRLNGTGYFYTFHGDGTGTLFNGASYYNGSYYSVVAGGVTGSYADGVQRLANDSKFYTFHGDGTGTLLTGAFYDNTSYYSIVAGEVTGSYADGVQRLANDSKFYIFDNSGSAGVLFTGSFQHGYYYNVDAGVLTATHASGVRQVLNDGLVYTFPGNGGAGELFTGRALVRDNKYYNIAVGVLGTLFDGAVDSSNMQYYNVDAGVLTATHASGVRILASDGLYYTFPGNGYAGTLRNGAVEIATSWYSVIAGVLGTLFDGAVYSSNAGYYYNVDAGVQTATTALGVRMLASDGLVYTFLGNGYAGALFTGGALVRDNKYYNIAVGVLGALFNGATYYNGSYYSIVAGEVTGSYANGVQRLTNDSKFYTFLGTGNLGTLFNGILEPSPGPSVPYTAYKDGAPWVTGNLIYHDQFCDSTENQIYVIIEGYNFGSKVIQTGTGTYNANYTAAGAKSGSFATGSKYTFSDGAIDSINNCDPYAAD